jgi:hypothetical protein
MMSRFIGLGCAFALVLALGCSAEKKVEPVPAEQHSHDTHTTTEKADMNEAFAELSEVDRKAAEAQKTCPVSGQPLGSMGTPIKVTVEGQDVFVCCEGCIDELKSNFAEYKAKLDK